MVMQDRKQARPTFVLDRGAYDAPIQQVKPGFPAAFPITLTDSIDNRMDLVDWLLHEDNPLAARVMVNRLWTRIFGKGLVATPDDFGSQGNLPTHPALLDYMAVRFVEQNWDIKQLLREIVCSATYKQSSVPGETSVKIDPANIYYSYFPAQRLTAEMIRDQALAASGLLSGKMGGPSVYPYQPDGLWKALAFRNSTDYVEAEGEDLYRRSLYTIWKRSTPPPAMMNFDTPDRYYCVVGRQQTATPLQSLVLMNDPTYVEAARVLGERMMIEAPEDIVDKIDFVYVALLGRKPKIEEMNLMKELYSTEFDLFRQQPQRASQWLGTGKHSVNQQLDKTVLASCTLLASTLLNFDEFVMKR